MFDECELIQEVRNADPMLLNELIRALTHRFEEINPDLSFVTFVVEKKRDFEEQADEYIAFMQRLKEIKVEEKKTKVIPYSPNK